MIYIYIYKYILVLRQYFDYFVTLQYNTHPDNTDIQYIGTGLRVPYIHL